MRPIADIVTERLAPVKRLICLDFETFYCSKTGYTLSKMTTADYVRDERFECVGVGVQIDAGTPVWMEANEFAAWADSIDWASSAVLAHHCVPGDVEVLTRSGWRRIADAVAADEIMQWDPATAALSWARPLAKTQAKASRVLRWDTNHHRCAYTPEHRMYYATPERADWRVKTAETVAEMGPNNVYIPTGGVYHPPRPLALGAAEARLMEAIRADGSWANTDGRCYGVRFKFTKPRKVRRLQQLCSAAGVPLKDKSRTPGLFELVIPIAHIRPIYAVLGAAKEYGLWVLDLSVDARRAVLDEARHWDGSQRKAPMSYLWSCARAATVEAFQLMAHASGWTFSGAWRDNQRGKSAHIEGAKLYVATVCEKQRAKLVERAKEERFDTAVDVYCFTVPTGAFLVRSGDRVHVTGNCHFDGLILAHHFGITPGFIFDTLSMARALHGTEVGNSLKTLATRYGVGEKGDEVVRADGRRRADFSPEEWARYGVYCCTDVEITHRLNLQPPFATFPPLELVLIDLTCRMFTEPSFLIDEPLLQDFLVDERRRKADLLRRVAESQGKHVSEAADVEELLEVVKGTLMSNDKFAALLESMGVEPPRKISPRTGEETFAFAKTDPGMEALLNHEADEVRWLAEARIGVKSTINESRAERFLRAGKGGRTVPVYLKYAAAHTFRWGGGDKMNFQNLVRGGALRNSLVVERRAP